MIPRRQASRHPHMLPGQSSWTETRPIGIRDQWNYRSFTRPELATATRLASKIKAAYKGKKTRRRLWEEEKERAMIQNLMQTCHDPYVLQTLFPTRRVLQGGPQHSYLRRMDPNRTYKARASKANMLKLSARGLTRHPKSKSKSK